jgi:hypothetical protein
VALQHLLPPLAEKRACSMASALPKLASTPGSFK